MRNGKIDRKHAESANNFSCAQVAGLGFGMLTKTKVLYTLHCETFDACRTW
jgi:hypothetical protein